MFRNKCGVDCGTVQCGTNECCFPFSRGINRKNSFFDNEALLLLLLVVIIIGLGFES